jgi:branched-chain amino acid transport system substrate-binding protein
MKSINLLARVMFTMILVIFFLGLDPGVSKASETYKVGVLQPFTGVYSIYGEEAYAACQVAADQINAAGGVLGRKIELVKKDTKAEVATGVTQAKDMILRDGVKAIIGPTSSSVLLGVLEVTKEHKILQISSIANTELATRDRIHPYYFQVVPNSYMESEAIAKYLSGVDFGNWVSIALDYEWGRGTISRLKAVLEKMKPNVKQIAEFWPPLKETDFSSYITATLNHKPDLVVGILAGSAYQVFIRQAKGYKFFEKTKFLTSGFEGDVMALGSEFPEGMRFYSRGAPYALKGLMMDAFTSAYMKILNKYPTGWSILSYDSMMVLAEAIKKAGTFDRDATARILATGKFQTLRGELYFRDIDHQMNSPHYFATSYYDKAKGFCLGKDVVIVPGRENFRSAEEIKKIRAEKGIEFIPWSAKK